MLEYFSYRKFKKHRDAKEAGASEVLDQHDEKYFEGLVDSPDAQEVPLQGARTPASGISPTDTPVDGTTPASSEVGAVPKKNSWKDTVTTVSSTVNSTVNTVSGTVSEYAAGTYEKAKHTKISEHLPGFLVKKDKANGEEKGKGKDKKGKGKMTKEEEEYYANMTPEEKELHEALDALSLAAQDGKAFSLSTETRGIMKQFTQILKDMANGVPTAYDDLVNLFETKGKQIETMFEEMPGFIKLLAKKLPSALGLGEKAVAAGEAEASALPGIAAQAATLSIPSLRQLAMKPGVVADTLKTVVNAIKLRFPGIAMGTNVVISMALFVLLFVFWYCWKRGREVRLEKEKSERETEEAKIAAEVLEGAPPVPTTDPGTSATTTTNTTIDQMIEPPHLSYAPLTVPVANAIAVPFPATPASAEVKPEKQIKDLF
ncbi:hypothetical protein H072_3261 [Dactylellina haptotyla CBS 200.50]|uniref:Uncharacterized protein n=1 Tax=Dactylellina haptotyla (strain CBS 200.50) TaxID=1284197 RepID=S8AIA7_DACHA|nr:hypothetical protein H072_3261 [Dactylellina haptotyla CBS 200.50]